jgi:nitrate/nitrite transport system substrate-binding protein
MEMNRRRFLAAGAALGISGVAGLAACSGPGSSASSPSIDPDAERGSDLEPLEDIEKPDLTIGFIPITCASPIINAEPLGFYTKHGLNVTLRKYPGWADIRDAYAAGEIDATHLLSPMPLALTNGFGSAQVPTRLAVIGNINGQAITLANQHQGNVSGPEDLAGMVLGVPFEHSMHNFLLRHYLSTGGLDPDVDVDIRVTRPPDMVANLITGNLDGYLGPDPFNQRAVTEGAGFIHVLTRDLWEGHPCCGFGVSDEFATTNPVTYRALLRAISDAALWSDDAGNRHDAAVSMAPEQYLNQSPELLSSILTGTFDNGLGEEVTEPDRIAFDPYPWQSFGVWILTQMQRWGYAPADAFVGPDDYLAAAAEVFDTESAAQALTDLGVDVPTEALKTETIIGETFDATDPLPWTRAVGA